MVNDYEIHAVFVVTEHQIQENIHFFMKSSLILDPFSTQIKSPTGNFRDIAHPCKLFTSQYLRYNDSLFLS